MRIPSNATTLTGLLALGVPLVWACSSDPSSPPTLRPLTLAVELVDSLGRPAPGGAVTAYTWPSPTLPSAPPDPDARTDSAGRLGLNLGQYPGAHLDSLLVLVQARGCTPPFQYRFEYAGSNLPPVARDTLPLRLLVAPVPPPAQDAPGAYCAFGLHPQWGPYREYGFHVLLDSAQGGIVRGRWVIAHLATYGSETGSVTGIIASGVVNLDLSNDVVGSTCAGRLAGGAHPDGTWSTVFFSAPHACEGTPSRLDFTMPPE